MARSIAKAPSYLADEEMRVLLTRAASVAIHLLGILVTAFFAVFHFLWGSQVIALCCICGFACVSGSLFYIRSGRVNTVFFYLFSLSLSVALATTSYLYGYRGILFLYPFTGGLYFMFRFRMALFCGVSISVICLYLSSLQYLALADILRYGLSLAITQVFSGAYSLQTRTQYLELRKEAWQDYLTGLMSRRRFSLWLDNFFRQSENRHETFCITYLDIDNFKHVNDTFGHAVGDDLLVQFAARIRSVIEEQGYDFSPDKTACCRLSGDEFALILPRAGNGASFSEVLEGLHRHLEELYRLETVEIRIYASVGYLIFKPGFETPESVINKADAAMYAAKQNGRGGFCQFDAAIDLQMRRQHQIECSLEQALSDSRFRLVYMPIFDAVSAQIVGVECLLRHANPAFADIGPEEFIPVAEKLGLIAELDLWVLKHAFRDFVQTLNMPHASAVKLYVNISAHELMQDAFPDRVAALARECGLPAERVCLEITETGLIHFDRAVAENANRLRSLGFGLALDDFGTGYTAFNQLIAFPVDCLKIDRSFVADLENSQVSREMVRIILSIAAIYGIRTAAEGVQNDAQLQILQQLKCEYLQGSFFSEPLAWDKLTADDGMMFRSGQ